MTVATVADVENLVADALVVHSGHSFST